MMILSIGIAANAEDRFFISVIPRLETGAKFGNQDGYVPNFGYTSLYSNFAFRINDNLTLRMNNRWFDTNPGALYKEIGNPQAVNWLDILSINFDKDRWHVSAGKLYIKAGGFEFESSNREFHHNLLSNFWMNIQPYTWGASVGYDVAWANTITLTVTNSPMDDGHFRHGLMSYCLSWDGNVGPVQTYWGFTMLQQADGSFIKMLGLGQRVAARDYSAELDYTVRSDIWSTLFTRESTLTLKLAYEGQKWFQIHLKGGWEFTTGDTSLFYPSEKTVTFSRDWIVPSIVEKGRPYFFGGLYAYFFPLKENKNMRLHISAAANNYYRGATVVAGILYKLDFNF